MDKNGGKTRNYNGTEFIPGKHIANWKLSAIRRGRKWELTNKDLDEKYKEQNGFCALSGIKMETRFGSSYRVSIDRIDSSKDYVVGNFQFVCCIVNTMKNKFSEDIFIQMRDKISKYRGVLQDQGLIDQNK